MKKLQLLTYLFSALLMVTMISCDNDDDENEAPTKEALLTADAWVGNKVYLQGIDVTDNPLTPFDVKDFTITFNGDGTYSGEIGGMAENGTWEFNQDQTQINMDKGTDDELIVDINRLTATELWAEGEFGDIGEKVEIRFIH